MLIPTVVFRVVGNADGPWGVAEAPLTLFGAMSALWVPREPLEASFHPCLRMAVYLPCLVCATTKVS